MFDPIRRPQPAAPDPAQPAEQANELLNESVFERLDRLAAEKQQQAQKKSPGQSPGASGDGSPTASAPSAANGKKKDGLAAARETGRRLKTPDPAVLDKAAAESLAFQEQTRKAQDAPLLTQLWNTAKNVAQKGAADLQATRAELDGTVLGSLPGINLDALFGGEGDIITESRSDQNQLLQSAIDNKKQAARPTIQSTSQLRPLGTADGWKDLTALVTNSLANAGLQIPATLATKGFSSLVQANGDIYLAGVQKLAEKEGVTPQQIVAQGKDEKLIPLVGAGISMLLDRVGAKGVADAVTTKELKSVLRSKIGQGLGAGLKEAGTETLQTLAENVAGDVSGGETLAGAVGNVELQDLKDAAVQGFLGGGGLAAAGGMVKSAVSPKNTGTDTETLAQAAARFGTENADVVAAAEEGELRTRQTEQAREQVSAAQQAGDPAAVIRAAERAADLIETQTTDANPQPTDPTRVPDPGAIAGGRPAGQGDSVPQPAETALAATPPADPAVPDPAVPDPAVPDPAAAPPPAADDGTGTGTPLDVGATGPDAAGDADQAAAPPPPAPAEPRRLSERDQLNNRVLGLASDYNSLDNRRKNGGEGSRIRRQILELAAQGGLAVKQEKGRLSVSQDGKPVKRVNLDTPAAAVENFVPLQGRDETVRGFIAEGVEAARRTPSLFFGLGLNLDSRDIAGAVADIDAGRNTRRAQKIMDTLEAAARDGFFRYTVRAGGERATYDIPADEYFTLAEGVGRQVEDDLVTEALADVLKNHTFTLDDILAAATSDDPMDANRLESTFYEGLSPEEFTEFVELLNQKINEREEFVSSLATGPAGDAGTGQATPQAGQTERGDQTEVPTPQTGTVGDADAARSRTGKSPRVPGESQFAKSVIDYRLLQPEQLAKDPVFYQVGTNAENIRQGLELLRQVGEAGVNARLTNYAAGNETFARGELKAYAVAGMLLVRGWDNARAKALAEGDTQAASELAGNIAGLVPQLSLAFTDGGQLVQAASLLDLVRSMEQVVFQMADRAVENHNDRVKNRLDDESARQVAEIVAQAQAEMQAEMDALRAENQTLRSQSAAETRQARKRIAENRQKAKSIVKAMFRDQGHNPCF